MGKPQIAVRIPPPLLAELNQYVERVGTSKTDVIISAISQYLGCAETVPLSQRVSELELQMKKLRTLIESYSSTEEGNQ
ncbi:MAG: DNA-binding domain-containing protein [Microcystis sp. M038S2]|jgi:metal-responsive CopG/Arc/MetJ family transcriptional regulator|uniref:DNA-binding domain-containing protein n=1 Tax=unclassified Microcystis TaxID=2643300 RepID=UPI001190336C|nr:MULTISPECIES: DNA-binding domain-containing protein [unclassified Microcystis]NCT42754.1 DNA-binding domain-containing protein [Microcystis aeruginosa G11-09]TRU55968.1 MAG: DNA-binding domain-containing protein [Microcystis aeruginosa Ma_QC_C_20070823_S13D]TRU64156.1 MAG: DNA-binding domain-containing protein [Microcystis aeruginosa Ma_QC_C_20070823_S13]MCA2686790.1 DNA-binding domain-containing protein [Microcystis sp. M046S2]MCA2704580.1 DNA-binding domain-containing protein [Microcystis